MGKHHVKKYLHNLPKEDLVEQVIELYESSKEVKKYYDFILKPDATKVIDDWKAKIGKEYFPSNGRKPKARRGTAQKAVREMVYLGFTPDLIADMRLFAIEIAIVFTESKLMKNDAFFKSFLRQYSESLAYLKQNGMLSDFKPRCLNIRNRVKDAGWPNRSEFELLFMNHYLKPKQ